MRAVFELLHHVWRYTTKVRQHTDFGIAFGQDKLRGFSCVMGHTDRVNQNPFNFEGRVAIKGISMKILRAVFQCAVRGINGNGIAMRQTCHTGNMITVLMADQNSCDVAGAHF